MFKQWKEKYLVLTMDGSLLVSRDAESAADQVVVLQSSCETIVEGREIIDLPRLPPGGRRDCCFALILPQDKFLLLLCDNPDECSLWLKLLRKVREGVKSPLLLQRQPSLAPCITDRDPLPDTPSLEMDPQSLPRAIEGTPPISRPPDSRGGSFRERGQLGYSSPDSRGGSFRERGQLANGQRRPTIRRASVAPPHRTSDCLRHGNSSDAKAVRAVCLLMGGAAASSALGYLNSCAPSSPLASRPPELPHSTGFSDLAVGGSFACSQDVDSPHFNSFDFEGDSDFDTFDCGGFAF